METSLSRIAAEYAEACRMYAELEQGRLRARAEFERISACVMDAISKKQELERRLLEVAEGKEDEPSKD